MKESAQQAQARFTTTAVSGNLRDSSNLVNTEAAQPNLGGVGKEVRKLFEDYKKARQVKEETWLEAWAAYIGSPEAIQHMRQRVAKIVGNVNDDWRHRINVGKAYEIVETINAYLMTAFFPNSDWFDVAPRADAGLEQAAKLARKFVQKKLKMAKFESYWEMYTRQLLITGFSVLALPWERRVTRRKVRREVVREVPDVLTGELLGVDDYEVVEEDHLDYDNVDLEVLDSFDCFVDPNANDLNKANFVRRMRKPKSEVMRCVATGKYPELDPMVVAKHSAGESEKARCTSNFMGVEYDPDQLVEVLEFWGDIAVDDHIYHDVVVTVIGTSVARFESNPYWGGRPFVIGTAIPVPTKVYGLGPLEPVLGMIHELNIITNQRLDNLELAVDTMWGMVDDGVTNAADLYTEPGKIVEMAEKGNVWPLTRDTSFTITYDEAAVQEQNIDKAVGVGAYIGTQQGRKGERVTAQEIQAVRDAGGNRLSSIHGHVEETQLHLFLVKMVQLSQQFVDHDEIVRLPGEEPDSIMYVAFGPRELVYDYDIEPVGAEYIANQEKELTKTMQYIDLVAQVPQFSEQVDWESLLRIVTRKFGFNEDLDMFLKQAAQPMQNGPEQAQPDPMAQTMSEVEQRAYNAGGRPAVNAALGEVAVKGPQQAMTDFVPTPGGNATPQ